MESTMHGIKGVSPSQVNYLQTMQNTQSTIRTVVSECVPEFPTELTELIASYTSPDHAADYRRLALNQNCLISASKFNDDVMENYKDALTSICDPRLKRHIMVEVISSILCNRMNLAIINNMFDEIRSEGNRISLDGTDLSALELNDLNLTGMSAVKARFGHSIMTNCIAADADFTGANFNSRTDLRGARLTNAILNDCIIINSNFRNTALDGVTAYGITMDFSSDFSGSTYTGINADAIFMFHLKRCATIPTSQMLKEIQLEDIGPPPKKRQKVEKM
jgi:uncharacterized protein YjbI with pentapeptide repeats